MVVGIRITNAKVFGWWSIYSRQLHFALAIQEEQAEGETRNIGWNFDDIPQLVRQQNIGQKKEQGQGQGTNKTRSHNDLEPPKRHNDHQH